MSRALRILAVVVVVLIVIVLVVPFLIPVNQFRPTIEQKASAALGRNVQVGNLSLSLFTGSLAADNLSIGDDPKFSQSPFLTAKSVKVGVELIPLIFSKEMNITGIVIDTPQVTLLRNPAGQWNYSTLGASPQKSQAEQQHTAPEPSKPAAAPVEQSQTNNPAASNSNEFSVQKLELKNGRITIGSTSSQKRTIYDKVAVTASDVSLTTKFPVSVSAELPEGGTFKLDGTAGPVDQADTTLTPMDAKLAIANLDLAKTGLLDPSAGLGGLLDLDASLASQNGEAQAQGTGKISKALFVSGGSASSIPVIIDFNTKYELPKNTGVLNPSTIKIGGAVAHLTGTYDTAGDQTVAHLKVEGQNLPAKDLEAFLPAVGVHMPTGASLQGGTLNTNLALNGPLNKLVTTGDVGLFSATLAGFDLGSKLAAASSLLGINTGHDLQIEKVTSNVRVAPDGIQATNFNAVLPALGTLIGGGDIDARNNLDFKMVASPKMGGASASANSAAPNGASAPPSGGGGILGKVLGGVTGSGGPLGSVGSSVGGVLRGCKGTTGPAIPFQIKGTTSDPKFVPDVGGIAAGMLKSQLGCMGGGNAPGTSNPNQQKPQNPLGGLFKKP